MPYAIRSLYLLHLPHQSIKIVIVNLPSHNHQPQKQDHGDDLQPKSGSPTTTYVVLRQPRECIDTDTCELLQVLAIAVDIAAGAVKLDGGFDQAGQPKDEEAERPQYYCAGD